ncbi:MAG TPA: hypothetical protein VJQ44_18830 [Gemmatimonadales bacterium]|nr:hypothetical protein [Gemmatimonadales bacterium]
MSQLALGGIVLGMVLWIVLSFVAVARYRQSDVSGLACLIAPIFVESPSYFRPEGQVLRYCAWLSLRLSMTALGFYLFFKD